MNIILASQSPRRKFLLEQMGLTFDTIPSNFEEYFDDERPVDEIVEELGLGKAMDVAKDHPDAIVIGSDLIVVRDGKQLGKPESHEEACELLRGFSGRSHELIASVAVVCLDKGYQKTASQTAKVTFDTLDEAFIKQYVDTGTTMDKAGGYAVQHPLMRPHVTKIEGRLDMIIGLPTDIVADMLADFDIKVSAVDMTDKGVLEKSGFYK